LLHLAATYQRTADQLAPQPPASLKFFAWAFGVDLKTMMQGNGTIIWASCSSFEITTFHAFASSLPT
jgi:hypothetical protein